MVLAAGLGRRLAPLTDETPKALLDFGGEPLLAILLRKLAAAECAGVVVNAHHLAPKIDAFLGAAGLPEGWLRVSREEEILGTGGGVRRAATFLGDDHPVLVHNVDVLSDAPFRCLEEMRRLTGAVVVLAVRNRETSRPLAVDAEGLLRGRWGGPPVAPVRGPLRPVAFSGISLLAPGVAGRLPGEGAFHLVDGYLGLVRRGETVRVLSTESSYWADLGTPERLARARHDLAAGRVPPAALGHF